MIVLFPDHCLSIYFKFLTFDRRRSTNALKAHQNFVSKADSHVDSWGNPSQLPTRSLYNKKCIFGIVGRKAFISLKPDEYFGKERRRKKSWITKNVLDLCDGRRDLKKRRYEAVCLNKNNSKERISMSRF